jgi:predicted DCC family thiol-disulfide oxidoreductase YuxK
MQNYNFILFDGVCNFCNFWVNFVIKRDKNNTYKFAAMQSESGQELLQKFKLNTANFDTFVLIVNNKTFTKSTAALLITKNLKSYIKLLYPLIILPPSIRDFFYDLIARNRYKFFGKRDFCMVPTKNLRDKFLF